MADRVSRLIVRLIDGVSGPAKTAAASLNRLVGASKIASVAPLGSIAAINRDVGILKRNVEKAATNIGLPMTLLGAVGAKTAYEFEKAGNAFRAVSGATAEQRKEIEKLATSMEMIKPTDAMKAAVELAKTGFNPDQVKGTLPGVLKLALSGDIDVPQGADIATNVLTSMRLPMANAEQAAASMARVNDVLSYTANKSNTDIRLLGETFKYVGPAAAAAGMSLEQVSAVAAVMANNGIRGSEAGVAMRSALVRMVKPTRDMLGALGALNINLGDFVTSSRKVDANSVMKFLSAGGIDASGAKNKIQQILDDPAMKFDPAGTVSKLTDAIVEGMGEGGGAMDRDKIAGAISDALLQSADKIDFMGFLEALKKKGATVGDIARIFDQRQGARLITALVGDVPGILADIMKNAFGYIEEAVKLRMEGIVGAWARLGSSMERVFIALGKSGVLDTVADAFDRIADAMTSLSQSNPQLLKWATYAGLATIAALPLGIALSGLGAIAGMAVGAINLLASGAIIALGAAFTPVGAGLLLAAGAIAAIGYAIYANWPAIEKFFGNAWTGFTEWLDRSVDGIKRMAAAFHQWANELDGKIQAFFSNAARSVSEWVDRSVQGLQRMVASFHQWASELGGNIQALQQGMYEAGLNMFSQLWEGMKAKAAELLSWVQGIGARIKGAFSFGGGGASASDPMGNSTGGSGEPAPPARAAGGRVSRGTSYLVGEHRPEIFSPNQDGYITSRAGAGAAGVTFSPTIQVSVDGAGDPIAVAEAAARIIQSRLREGFRGVMADAGMNFA